MEHAVGWRWFAAWGLAGGLLFFAILTGFSIGLFVLPFAALAVWFVGRSAARWPEMLGVALGGAAVCLAVAAANWDYTPCPDGPITLSPGEASFSCGGFDPMPWLLAGIVLGVAGPLGYLLARPLPALPSPVRAPLSTREKVFLAIVLVLAAFSIIVLISFAGGSGESREIEIVPASTVSEP
jgi:hypothetical protein